MGWRKVFTSQKHHDLHHESTMSARHETWVEKMIEAVLLNKKGKADLLTAYNKRLKAVV